MDLSRSEAVVEISVKLVEEGAGRIAAAKIFSARAPVASDDAAPAALDAALGLARRRLHDADRDAGGRVG